MKVDVEIERVEHLEMWDGPRDKPKKSRVAPGYFLRGVNPPFASISASRTREGVIQDFRKHVAFIKRVKVEDVELNVVGEV